jgi:hypothetical protein
MAHPSQGVSKYCSVHWDSHVGGHTIHEGCVLARETGPKDLVWTSKSDRWQVNAISSRIRCIRRRPGYMPPRSYETMSDHKGKSQTVDVSEVIVVLESLTSVTNDFI